MVPAGRLHSGQFNSKVQLQSHFFSLQDLTEGITTQFILLQPYEIHTSSPQSSSKKTVYHMLNHIRTIYMGNFIFHLLKTGETNNLNSNTWHSPNYCYYYFSFGKKKARNVLLRQDSKPLKEIITPFRFIYLFKKIIDATINFPHFIHLDTPEYNQVREKPELRYGPQTSASCCES